MKLKDLVKILSQHDLRKDGNGREVLLRGNDDRQLFEIVGLETTVHRGNGLVLRIAPIDE